MNRDEHDSELRREIDSYVQHEIDDNLARGMSPQDAEAAARKKFGNVGRVREQVREMSWRTAVDSWAQDGLLGLRLLRRDPRYAAMLLVTLATCLGANIAIYSVVQAVLLRPLAVADADEILLMANRYPKANAGVTDWSAPGDYYDRAKAVSALQDQALFNMPDVTIESGAGPEQVKAMGVTPSWFPLLRLQPVAGRAFTQSEGEPGEDDKVILSDALWHQLYAGAPEAVGQKMRIGGKPFTIVGVMGPGFTFVNPEVRLWFPLAFSAEDKELRHSNNWYNVGRLRKGATMAQAQAQVDAVNASNLERFPAMREVLLNVGFETRVRPLQDLLVGNVKSSLYLLWAAAGMVLLLGALNVGSLVIARTSGRTKELGTRLALGAGLGRLARQLVVENIVLAMVGGLLGLGLAWAVVKGLGGLGLDQFPRAGEVMVDASVALFALGLSTAAGLFIGLLSLGYTARLQVSGALQEFSRTATGGRRRGVVRKVLVIAQVGLAFVLAVGAGLLYTSFRELRRVDPGYESAGVLTGVTTAPRSGYPGGAECRQLIQRTLDAVRRLPGVVLAGATTEVPLSGERTDSVIFPEGFVVKKGESLVSPSYLRVSPGYMETMGMRLLRGRFFDERDNEKSKRVILVDQNVAQRFWPGQNPLGRRMFFPNGAKMAVPDEKTPWMEVVGVVDSVRLENMAGDRNSAGAYYTPIAQDPPRSFAVAMKGQGELGPALRRALKEVDPNLALFDVRTMAERQELSLAGRKAGLTLALAFGGVALFLASVGIYGVLAYLLAQRRREIGIRMAMGSSQGQIFGLILREGVWLAGLGIASGFAGAVLGRGAAEAFLYGVRPLEPTVLIGVGLLLGFVALAAMLGPAWQATRVDPVEALQQQ